MSVESAVIRLTPSLVGALRQCGHRELWMREHPELRAPFQETPASARGKSLHAALAEFHREGGASAFTLPDLYRLLGRNWIREGYPDAEEERLARLRCEAELEGYYQAFGAETGTLVTERTWQLYRDLDGIQTEWYGRMDWLREHSPGVLEVVDWKNRGQVTTPEALAADPVTVMYGRLGRSFAVRFLGWPGGKVLFSHLYLDAAGRGPEKVTVEITREMVGRAEEELADLAEGLQKSFFEPTEGVWCTWGSGGCPVKAAGRCELFPVPQVEGDW